MSNHASQQQERQVYRWLCSLPRTLPISLWPLLVAASLLFTCKLVTMWFVASASAQLIIEQQTPEPSTLSWLVAALLVQAAFTFFKHQIAGQLELTIKQALRKELETQLVDRNLALVRTQSNAFWQASLMDRVPLISRFYVDYLVQQRVAMLAPVMVLVVVGAFNWLLVLVLLVSAPLVPVFMWLTGMGAAAAHREHFDAIDKLSHQFLDRLRARQLLRVHQRETAEIDALALAGRELNSRMMKVLRMAFLSSSVLDFFATVAMALVAVLVGFYLLGEINVGSWREPMSLHIGLFILLITPLFFSELKLLGRFYHTKSEAIGAAISLKPLLDSQADSITGTSLPMAIPPGRVLDDEDGVLLFVPALTVRAGQHIRLLGDSGAGKTVLLETLMGQRRFVPDVGTSRKLEPSTVFWLGQHAAVTPGSIRDNLTLGHSFSDAHLMTVLEQVELLPWMGQFEAGLGHTLGENPPLSGGEAQRLNLARALLFDKPIVILDEPTAHLCDQQHQRLCLLLKRHLADKTLIWVSHREIPVEHFDQYWYSDSATKRVRTFTEACDAAS